MLLAVKSSISVVLNHYEALEKGAICLKIFKLVKLTYIKTHNIKLTAFWGLSFFYSYKSFSYRKTDQKY